MRIFLKLAFLALMGVPVFAQIPAPQINLTGNIGCQGFPCTNSGTLIFSSDANHTMTAQESSAFNIKVTSSVSLTGTRNLIAPTGRFAFTIENATTGGQSIQIIGQSGTGITIPNGLTYSVWFDGTNYVQATSASSYTLPIATPSTLGGVKPDGTTTTVNPSTGVITATGSGGSSPFPSSFTLAAEGASLDQSLDIQQEVIISASNPGSGYTSGSTCTTSISGLTGTAQPTVGAYVDTSGHVQWSLTYFGEGLTGTGTATVTGGCGSGSGASATLTVPMTTCTTTTGTANCYTNPWTKQLTTLSAMNGRVSAFTNYAVSGSNVTDAISRATSNNYAAFCAASANQYFIVGGDLLFNSMSSYGSHPNLTAQVAYAQWISLIHYLKNNGCKVIVTTPNVGSTYAGGTGSSMNGTFVNRVQTAAQLIRNGTPGTDYDYLIDIASALQTNTDPTFFSFDNTHWTLAGDTMVAQFANGALLAGGGPNLAPYYNLPATFDANGAVDWNLASCTAFCFNITAGDGEPGSIESTQTNQLSGWFFMNGSGIDEGHVGYGNGTYGGLGGNLIEVGPDSDGPAAGSALVGPSSGSSYVKVTNQIDLYSSVVEMPQQAAGSGHDCAQFDTSGILTNTGSPCGSGSMVYPGAGVPVSTGSAWATSKTLGGTDVAIPTGPAATISGDAVTYTGTAGQQADAGFAPAPALTCTATIPATAVNNGCYNVMSSASMAMPSGSFTAFSGTTNTSQSLTLTSATFAYTVNCGGYISGSTLVLTGNQHFTVYEDTSSNVYAVCTAAGSGTGLSGMTAGQVPIAATSSTVTSSKPLNGSGGGIPTGPTSSVSADLATFTGTAGQLQDGGTFVSNIPSQYKTWSCQPGLGDGVDALENATYNVMECWNTTGVAVVINAISCYADAASPTLQVSDYNGTSLVSTILASAVTCANPAAAGTISGSTYSFANGDHLEFTFVGTTDTMQSTWIVGGTY